MKKSNNKLYYDDCFVSETKQLKDSLTPGLGYANGVFESFVVGRGNFDEVDKHWLRFHRGSKIYGMKNSYNLNQVKSIIGKLLKLNDLKLARVRIVLQKNKKIGKLSVQTFPFKRKSVSQYKKGYRLKISPFIRKFSYRSHIKSLDYKIFRDALIDANDKGYDEALLLNSQKNVVEGATSNIFIVKNGRLLTPKVGAGCLSGVTRKKVVDFARTKKWNVDIKDVSIDDVYGADMVFMTNSVMGAMPISMIDRKVIDTKNYFEFVGDFNLSHGFK